MLLTTEEQDTELDRYEDHIHFPLNREQNRAQLEKLADRERTDDSFFWMVENNDGQHVGYINTFDCARRVGAFKYVLIIHRPFWARGYAREATIIVLRYYFRELHYQKVTVLVYSFNECSIHLHEKFGFQFEGRLRRMAYTNGQLYDELYYGMTCEEFDAIDPKVDSPEYLPRSAATTHSP